MKILLLPNSPDICPADIREHMLNNPQIEVIYTPNKTSVDYLSKYKTLPPIKMYNDETDFDVVWYLWDGTKERLPEIKNYQKLHKDKFNIFLE